MLSVSRCDFRAPEGQLRLFELLQKACRASKSYNDVVDAAAKARDKLRAANCTLSSQVAGSFAESFTVLGERLFAHAESLPTRQKGPTPLEIMHDMYKMFPDKDELGYAFLECQTAARWMKVAAAALSRNIVVCSWFSLLLHQINLNVLDFNDAGADMWWFQAARYLTVAMYKAMVDYALVLDRSRTVDTLQLQSATLHSLLRAVCMLARDEQQQGSSGSSGSMALLLTLCQRVLLRSQKFWDMLGRQLAQGERTDAFTLHNLAGVAAMATLQQDSAHGTALASSDAFAAAAADYVIRATADAQALQENQECVDDILQLLDALLLAPQPPAALLQRAGELAAAALAAATGGRHGCNGQLLRTAFNALRTLHLQQLPWQQVAAVPRSGQAAMKMMLQMVDAKAAGRAVASGGDGVGLAAVEVVLRVMKRAITQQQWSEQELAVLERKSDELEQQLEAATGGGAGRDDVSKVLGLCGELLNMVVEQQEEQQEEQDLCSSSAATEPGTGSSTAAEECAPAAPGAAVAPATTSMPSSSKASKVLQDSSNTSATTTNPTTTTDITEPRTSGSTSMASSSSPAMAAASVTASTAAPASTSTSGSTSTSSGRRRRRVLIPRLKPGTQCAACGAGTQQVRLFKVCGGCDVARYCNETCQRAHWQQHKQQCGKGQQLRPAAA